MIVGRPTVTSAGSLAFDGTRVALWGVRAPTIDQTCRFGDGAHWACGAYAFTALYSRVGGRSVWCLTRGRTRESIVAQCFIGVVDVAQQLVEQGWATSDELATTRYVGAEAESRRANRGMWKAPTMQPHSLNARAP